MYNIKYPWPLTLTAAFLHHTDNQVMLFTPPGTFRTMSAWS